MLLVAAVGSFLCVRAGSTIGGDSERTLGGFKGGVHTMPR